jgi:hypothetical protein
MAALGLLWRRPAASAGATAAGWQAGRLPSAWPRLEVALGGGSIVAPGAWKWPAGVVPAVCAGLGRLRPALGWGTVG